MIRILRLICWAWLGLAVSAGFAFIGYTLYLGFTDPTFRPMLPAMLAVIATFAAALFLVWTASPKGGAT